MLCCRGPQGSQVQQAMQQRPRLGCSHQLLPPLPLGCCGATGSVALRRRTQLRFASHNIQQQLAGVQCCIVSRVGCSCGERGSAGCSTLHRIMCQLSQHRWLSQCIQPRLPLPLLLLAAGTIARVTDLKQQRQEESGALCRALPAKLSPQRQQGGQQGAQAAAKRLWHLCTEAAGPGWATGAGWARCSLLA